MPNNAKRIFPFLAAVAAALLLFSCARVPAAPVSIGGTDIPAGIWAYYLDSVTAKPAEYGLSPMAEKADYIDKTNALCAEYIAVNTEFFQPGLSLGGDRRAAVSETVNDLWRVYGAHYLSIGTDKQTLTKIQTNLSAREALFLGAYDTGGKREVPEAEIKDYYNSNFVVFRAVNGYFTSTAEDGTVTDLSPAQVTALEKKFNGFLERLGEGESLEDIAESYAAEQGSASGSAPTSILRKASASYPEGFFDKVSALEPGDTAVLTFDKYIFLVEREDAFVNDGEFYLRYRTQCLTALRIDEFDADIADIAQGYDIVENDKEIEKLYKKIHTA